MPQNQELYRRLLAVANYNDDDSIEAVNTAARSGCETIDEYIELATRPNIESNHPKQFGLKKQEKLRKVLNVYDIIEKSTTPPTRG